MANNKIGCSAGKTSLVDPNAFDGQSSVSNMFVPLEDLSIYVQLETHRKARTVLTSDGPKNTGETSKPIRVTFIEGSEVNGKKVLTSKFTDLTTSFDTLNNEEGLGITGIDIDFNSSYAPLITINFIDVRGTSIFQNENNLIEGRNKYGTFFQLPYPLYSLTIKGYYGMPVSYCLHMTKFTSRFNSQTGNFEITANFVGYTYAMLSDILIGFLKVINYTELGDDKYKALKPSVITLNTLLEKISNINTEAQKISADDPAAIDLSRIETKQGDLSAIKSNIFILGQDVDIKKDLDEYKFIIVDPAVNLDEKIKKYIDAVKANIDTYNSDDNVFSINESDFTGPVNQNNQHKNLTIKMLEENKSTQGITDDFRTNLLKYLTNLKYGFPKDKEFTVYDLRNLYVILDKKSVDLNKYSEKLQEQLGNTLRAKISDTLGFDPTIRNLINVFTTAAEVFLSVLYDVSTAAKNNPSRTAQLKKFSNTLNQSFDYKASDNGGGQLTDNYYPWPDYRKRDNSNGLVEAYLGEAGVLETPSDVNELVFIDDLLRAFLKARVDEERAQLVLESEQTNWYGANPIDTRLMGLSKTPYQRIEANTYSEIIRMIMIRGMIHFYSNKQMRGDEIQAIALAEINSALKYCVNEKAVEALGQAAESYFMNASGNINAQEEKVINGPITSFNLFYYNYIFGNSTPSSVSAAGLKVLPLNGMFEGNISPNYPDLQEKASEGNLFLTNYTTTGIDWTKTNDGGVYVKMFTRPTYDATAYPTPEPIQSQPLDFATLKKSRTEFPTDGTGSGLQVLSGPYGVQEFMSMNFGESQLDGLPFRYMFYENSNYDKEVYNKSNGLGRKRSKSKNKEGKVPTTPFDISGGSVYQVATDWNDITQYIDDDETVGLDFWATNSERVHAYYGRTRELANEVLHGSRDICYPFINFQVKYEKINDDKNLAPVSLFGSRFYYEQTSEYSKALLFLHTFPWNGLITTEADDDWMNVFANTANNTIFDKPEIYNTFGNRAGFISAPRLWVAFIGGLLWRADYSTPIMDDDTGRQVGGGSGTSDPILFHNGIEAFIPTMEVTSTYPSKWEYLTKSHGPLTTEQGRPYPNTQMTFDKDDANLIGISIGHQYKSLDTILLGLPEQAKNEFKKVFFDFVMSPDINGISTWDQVKAELQVFNGTGAQWVSAYANATNPTNMFIDPSTDEMSINYTNMTALYNNVDDDGNLVFKNYTVFTPLFKQTEFENNYICEINEESSANDLLLKLMDEEIIIANMSWMPWQQNDVTFTDQRRAITATEDEINLYVRTIVNKLTEVKDGLSASDKKKEREQEIFGTSDENVIKLQLYRTCKNIYDKWIGGADDGDNIIFQCGGRNSIDKELAAKAGRSTPKLIDSFRFVTRSFRDIGDEMVVNPVPISDFLTDNPNISFYDAVTSLLSANNFDFVPLPTYVNYEDPDVLKSIFTPMSTIESFKAGTVGPSFVCVYVGQKSKHLDTNESDYPNDGFDFRCSSDGNMMPNIPQDFKNDAQSHENKVAVFAVNYSQQNQNIFKDILLDQSEFTETAESLQITDEIANKGAENNRTLAGQNLYNVYAVRSYKAGVEMMGNAMIQPMMYFQLNNIPMFHGAYLITHVKHSIKPNTMSTHFEGVRVREPETPLIKASDLFMSLLDSIASSNVKPSDENNITQFGSVTGNIEGKFKMPNTVSVSELKNKININKFNAFKDVKFTKYGDKQ